MFICKEANLPIMPEVSIFQNILKKFFFRIKKLAITFFFNLQLV